MAFPATSPLNIIAMVGFLLSALTYLTHAFGAHETVKILIGMSVISAGYSLLFSSKLIAYIQKKREDAKERDVKKKDIADESANPKLGSTSGKNTIQYFGYATLATFFIMTFFFRDFTIHYRFYDFFAASGYLLMMLTKYIPLIVPLILIILYYFFGGVFKIWEKGWVNKVQLVARSLLVIYYTGTLMSSLHLF